MTKEKLIIKAYQEAFDYKDDVAFYKEDIQSFTKFLDKYLELDILEKIRQTPMQIFSAERPHNKPREIALEIAVKIIGNNPVTAFPGDEDDDTDGERTLKLGEKIYQWLIKKDNHDAGGNKESSL